MSSDRKPRICLMTKGENGYGFHLHGEKGKSGQFIRKVEPGSPAEASGLRAGDRVVAVNGVNVEKETHHEASAFIFAVLNYVTGRALVALAVVDQQVTPAGTCILTQRASNQAIQAPTPPYELFQNMETFIFNFLSLSDCPHETKCCFYHKPAFGTVAFSNHMIYFM